MPKKRNFLDGMQNYNPNNGEYESALVGPNGKVAKDADGDGEEHESKKQPQSRKQKVSFNMLGRRDDGSTFNMGKANAYKLENNLGVDIEPGADILGDGRVYKIHDLETGAHVGYAKNYEDALEQSKNMEFINKIQKRKQELNLKQEKTKGKSETRKDKYGNSLLSDDAFKIGVEAMKKYIAKFEPMAKSTPNQTAHEFLKGSNIYVDALTEVASDAIEEAGLNPDFDITYQYINEMIGAATGDEIDVENSKQEAKFDAWTGKKYNGYDPSKSSEQEKTKKSFSKFGKEKIDEEEAPYFKSAKAIDSFSFEKMLLNDIKQNPENYNKIVLNDKEYVRKGNSFDVYRNQKLLYSGTFNSVASDINQEYLDVESKMDNSFSNINKKRMGLPF